MTSATVFTTNLANAEAPRVALAPCCGPEGRN
jgi:hypothetical protein